MAHETAAPSSRTPQTTALACSSAVPLASSLRAESCSCTDQRCAALPGTPKVKEARTSEYSSPCAARRAYSGREQEQAYALQKVRTSCLGDGSAVYPLPAAAAAAAGGNNIPPALLPHCCGPACLEAVL